MNPIKHYSYLEANSFSASQEIPGLLCNPKIAHCIQYNLLLPSVRNIQFMLSCPTYLQSILILSSDPCQDIPVPS